MTVQMRADEVRAGDVWLGEDYQLRIESVDPGFELNTEQMFIPWGKGRDSIPVPMKPVKLYGSLYRFGLLQYQGPYTLQPDQIMEIERSA